MANPFSNLGSKAAGQVSGLASSVGSAITSGVQPTNVPTYNTDIKDLTEDGKYLQYPLHDVTKYPMYVTFQTYVAEAPEHNTAIEDFSSKNKSFWSYANDLVDKAPSRAELSAGFLKDNEPLDIASMEGTAQPATRQPAVIGANLVRLYLPQQVQFMDGMSYGNVSLGPIGAAIEAGINSGRNMSIGDITGDAISKGINGIIDGITANLNTDLGAVALQRVAGKLPGGDTITGAIRAGTATTLHPSNRTLFQEVQTRTFAYSFSMIATSQEEAKVIESIVKHFRTEMYPTEIMAYKDENGVGIPVGYRFPKKWQIRFWDGASQKRLFEEMLPCYLTNMTTTYNSGESTFHWDGKPTSVEITLTFMEERPLSRQDVISSYDAISTEAEPDDDPEYEYDEPFGGDNPYGV